MNAQTINNKISRARAVTIASIGGGLEMYDFSIYIFFAPIIAELFFPHTSYFASLLLTLAIFAVGYFSRPLGAIIFGHYGDRIGRKTGLVVTIVLMAVSTALIGLLPTYATIGILAPLFLVILRFLQGVAVGGDLPGAVTFVAEYADNKNRGFACSLIYFSVNIGLLMASVMGGLLTYLLSHEQLLGWGWRLAFLLGIVLGIVGFYLRKKIADTPYFQQLAEQQAQVKIPSLQLLKENTTQILQGIGLVWLLAVAIAQLFLYMPTYLHTMAHLELTTALLINSANILLFSLCIPLIGYLSDKIGRKPIILLTAFLFIVFSYPLYTLLNHTSLTEKILALNCFALLAAGIVSTVPSTLAELFPTHTRYSGVGIAYNISFAIFAGLAPVIATFLIEQLHQPQAPSYNLIAGALVAFVACITLIETSKKPLQETLQNKFVL